MGQVAGREVNPDRTILLVLHSKGSTPGRVGEALERKGYRLKPCRPCAGETLPQALDGCAAAVVFGGPMSANDDKTKPFIGQELKWIETAIETDKPFLGICLGAQLLARVLGARVGPHAQGLYEIGYYPLRPTPEGEALFGRLERVYHWHGEGFELPHGAELLARGTTFPNQAYRYGGRCYGVQFHPDVDRAMMCLWLRVAADKLKRPGAQSWKSQIEGSARFDAAIDRWLDRFLDHWLTAES